MHIVTGGLGVREGLEWRADDPYSAGARMEGPPRTNKAVTPAEAGAGRAGKGDDERNVSAARYPYVQVFDDLMELQRHTQQLTDPRTPVT